jgi:hypothetical protein
MSYAFQFFYRSISLEGRDHSEDLGVDWEIIKGWILGKWWEGVDQMNLPKDREQWPCSYEHSDEPSGSTKGREFLG